MSSKKQSTRREILAEIESIETQIAVQESLLSSVDEHRKQVLQKTIADLNSARHGLLTRLARAVEIYRVPEDASDAALDEHRAIQPVMRGIQTYLPVARTGEFVNLPDCLLRSAVFGSGRGGEVIRDHRVGSHRTYDIRMSGFQLNAYDRRVLAVCLAHYQEGSSARKRSGRQPLPLGSKDSDDWVETSYWKLARSLGRSFGVNVATAIDESLQRLRGTEILVSLGSTKLPSIPLLEAELSPGDDGLPRAGDSIAFRVVDTFAYLYILSSPAKSWTAMPKSGLADNRGLASWLACYYSSHGKAFTTEIANLQDYCNASCKPNEFRRRLKNALTDFQAEDTPDQFRVASFDMTRDQVRVELARWREAKDL